MKAFLEEYGFAILAAIVVILLIVMASPVGQKIKEGIMYLVDKFNTAASGGVDTATDALNTALQNVVE